MAYVSPILARLQRAGYGAGPGVRPRRRRPPLTPMGAPVGAGFAGQNALAGQQGRVAWGGQYFDNPAALVAWANARGAQTSVPAWLASHPGAAGIFGLGNGAAPQAGPLGALRAQRPRRRRVAIQPDPYPYP